MSFQTRNERRDNNHNNRSRFSNPAQGQRQEWIPRGSNSTVITPPTTAAATLVSNPNGNSANSNARQVSTLPIGRNNRGNPGNIGHFGRVGNQRREGRFDSNHEQRGSKVSPLPQLVQEIQEKLLRGTIECMICYDMVKRSASIWSCASCYSIFHLHCIKKWARAPTSIDLSAEKNQGFNWRCPGCQSVQLLSSKDIVYVCFCGKRQEPPSDLYLTPHSCGEPCGKQLEKEVLAPGVNKDDMCPHLCVLQCHPGPCPPCKAFAPPRICPCGKKTITTRCSDRKSVLTCGKPCGKLLGCLRHHCERMCHVGPCDPCHLPIRASCFCRKKTEVVLCGDMTAKGEMKEEDGLFSCSSPCGKILGCNNHACRETCHPGPCGECELLPGRIKTCYCGKTGLLEPRLSCLDLIPSCSQTCEKSLPCRLHHCKDKCHPGECAPCPVMVTQKCRCGSSSRTVECYKTMTEADMFTCNKPCGRKKNCGRHRCSEKCCPLSNSNSSRTAEWDPHLCSMPCEKKLRCGQHKCESLCHSGHCPPCPETIFSDLTCACGRSSVPPPLPCGTPPPSCQYPCSVPQPCGHSSSHSCHFGDCPPCSVPIAKECIGGHVVLRNIPCGSKDIRCNKLCGKTRQCGMHACLRTCHPLPCDSSAAGSASTSTSGGLKKVSCGQTCGAPRRDCRHTCSSLCHPYAACPDVRCEFPVTISCLCGRITATVPCDAGGNNSSYNVDSVLEASVIQKLPGPLQPVETNGNGGKRIPLGQRKLMCDDECSKMERKRVLADAFGVVTPNLDALHFGENAALSDLVGDLFRRDPKWALSVEERCKFLVLGKGRGCGSNGLKVHVFSPMLKEKRDAVRLIAERWKLSINAAGWEPKRFIVVSVTSKSKAPARILGGAKGLNPSNIIQSPPVFDPLVDMDPRLVVTLFDLPGDADVSALVLRFGGECELVWLNDKNALSVFSDPARAATAMRRLNHGSVYHGAAVLHQGSATITATGGANNAWGVTKGNSWKKAVVQDPPSDRRENSWGVPSIEEWAEGESGGVVNKEATASTWQVKEAPSASLANRWTVLDGEVSHSTSEECEKHNIRVSEHESKSSSSNLNEASAEVVLDWEEAYD